VLTDEVQETLIHLVLTWQLQDVSREVRRLTCAPATTSLTSQLVGMDLC